MNPSTLCSAALGEAMLRDGGIWAPCRARCTSRGDGQSGLVHVSTEYTSREMLTGAIPAALLDLACAGLGRGVSSLFGDAAMNTPYPKNSVGLVEGSNFMYFPEEN